MTRSVTDVHAAVEVRVPRTVSAKEAGVVRYRRVRTYPQGNLRDQVTRCESVEELRKFAEAFAALTHTGQVSNRTARKVWRAIARRKTLLEARRVVLPGAPARRTKGGLYLP